MSSRHQAVQLMLGLFCVGCSGALLRGGTPPPSHAAFRSAAQLMPAAPVTANPLLMPRRAVVHMQQSQIDKESQAFYDGYVQTDPETGESRALDIDDKEKLYLECLDAFYNEGGKQLLSNEEYEKLKLDLDFDGSKIAVFSKDEIKFVLANKRFKMGKQIMDDVEYDALRKRLKEAGSSVVIHEGASCNIDGICKSDLKVDTAKTRLLYLPGTVGGSIFFAEALYWTLHFDPILGILFGAVPSYFFGVWFTENVFAQKPLVAQGPCPTCQYLQPVFFGDLFSVSTDGMAGPPTVPGNTVTVKCVQCKVDMVADREKMLYTSEKDLKKMAKK